MSLRFPFRYRFDLEDRERFVYSCLISGSETCLIDSRIKERIWFHFDYLKNTGRKPEEILFGILTSANLIILAD